MMPNIAYISLGSNVGDKLQNLVMAKDKLEELGIALLAVSSVYLTSPQCFVAQDDFLNQVLRVHTKLSPFSLLKQLKKIEMQMGRDFTVARFGPRVIDLDILLYANKVIQTKELTIPHPRLWERNFILTPLLELMGKKILKDKISWHQFLIMQTTQRVEKN
jgi:2-amino-4-hydroxy-6-hydroxymethyldihydropteridine diphosphokinase